MSIYKTEFKGDSRMSIKWQY